MPDETTRNAALSRKPCPNCGSTTWTLRVNHLCNVCSPARPAERYAHPMGWRTAALFGIAYGGVLGGIPWLIWRAVSLAGVPWRVDVVFGLVFLMGLSCPLLMESEEHRKVKEGWTNLGKPTRVGESHRG